MHVVVYFNSTHAELDGSWHYLKVILFFETLLQCFSIFYNIVVVYLNAVTALYHVNMRILFGFFTGQYFFFVVGRLIHLRYIFGLWPDYEIETVYLLTSEVRLFCAFLAFYYLPIAIIERCCATYYSKNYEKYRRLHISFLLIALHTFTSAVSTVVLRMSRNTLAFIGICITANVLAVIANLINERVNLNLFKRSTLRIIADIKNYSLTERFQLSENIKTCKSFNNVVLSIMFFNMICIGSFAIESFDVTILIKNISNILLSYSILMYGITMPLVMLHHNERWQKELKRLLRKVRRNRIHHDPTLHIKSTFGQEMVVSNTQQSQRYFEMLQKDLSFG